jgi:hypothetical protein
MAYKKEIKQSEENFSKKKKGKPYKKEHTFNLLLMIIINPINYLSISFSLLHILLDINIQ